MDRPTAGQAYSRTPISKSNGSINFHTPNQKVMVGVVPVPPQTTHIWMKTSALKADVTAGSGLTLASVSL